MKSLMKIYSRYILTACLLIILLAIVNILLFLGTVLYHSDFYQGSPVTGTISDIAEQILCIPSENNGNPFLPEEGIALLQSHNYCFSFLLSPTGDVVWEWQVPEEFPDRFSAADISAFSKWYLQDYPVKTWRYGDHLLVCGHGKYSVWKHYIEFPETFMEHLISYLGYALISNLIILLSILLIAGFRFYSSLRPLIQGVDALADGNALSLAEKGVIAELCGKLNRTSRILKKQKDALTKRDNARTEWISGVSHDIRTPLSMIMGYADSLSADSALSAEQHKQAEIIKTQSMVIRKLIEDLNLTSRLEYHMQPLRISKFLLAPFLRALTASHLNDRLKTGYDIELGISEDFRTIYMEGDEPLLNRAVNNLINNSIQHNPAGCHIRISATLLNDHVCSVCIHDNGIGIPEQVIRTLEGKTPDSDSQPHIMGLRIAKQIVLSHRGNFYFSTDRHSVIMELPVLNGSPCNSRTIPVYDR